MANNTKNAAWFVYGMVAAAVGGGVIGYILAEQQMAANFEQELEEFKAEFSALAEAKATARINENQKADFTAYVDEATQYGGSLPDPRPVPGGTKVAMQEELKRDLQEQVSSVHNAFDAQPEIEGWDQRAEELKRSAERPYIISVDEWEDLSTSEETVQLTYYAEDDVLADGSDMPVDNQDRVVGDDNLSKFGHGSGDPETVFVRNENLGALYEIARVNGSYARDVANIIQHSDKPRVRRFRDHHE